MASDLASNAMCGVDFAGYRSLLYTRPSMPMSVKTRHKHRSPMMGRTSLSKPDKGYAWVVAFASCISHAIIYGISWSVGVFFDVFKTEFVGSSSGSIALIASLNTCSVYLAGPLAAVLANRFGCRPTVMVGGLLASLGLVFSMLATEVWHLYITFGIITGFSLGIAYIPAITVVGYYFIRRRPVGIAIAVSGLSIGTFIFPPLIRLFCNEYGWRGGTLLTGGVCLNICACGALMRPAKFATVLTAEKECKAEENTRKGHFNVFIFKNLNYIILGANNTLFSFGLSIVYVHLATYSETLGCSKDEAALLFSIIAAGTLVGRILVGFLSHNNRVNPTWLYLLGLFFGGIATVLSPLAVNYAGLVTYAALFGIFTGGIGPLLPLIQIEMLDVSLLASSYGYILVFEAIGQVMGAPIAGLLYDRTERYSYSFYLGGAILVVSGLIMICPWYRMRRSRLLYDKSMCVTIEAGEKKMEKGMNAINGTIR